MDPYLPPDFDLPRMLFERAHNDLVGDARVKCLLEAYGKALEDPKTVMPTALHAAIEALRRG